MRKESFYLFILYVLRQEGKSYIPFKIESLLLGKRRASVHWFRRLFAGCDVASFKNYVQMFQQEYPTIPFAMDDAIYVLDNNGVMIGLSGLHLSGPELQ